MEVDPAELEQMEERLDVLYRLSRKYGETEEEMLAFLGRCRAELERITLSEEEAQQLEQAFALGINKFNVATEYIMLYEKLLHQYYTEKFGKCSPFEKFPFVRKQLTEYVAEKLTLCKLTV